jgi:hypothetical protein
MQCCELNDGGNSGQTNMTIYEVKKRLGVGGRMEREQKQDKRDEYMRCVYLGLQTMEGQNINKIRKFKRKQYG